MNADQHFEIKLPQFEGPFDLLLFFIERDELDIHDIAIARITDDFLGYLHRMSVLNIELASDFIVVAATLMRIKARQLLPRYRDEADNGDEDIKYNLVQKLIDYRRFKQVAEQLSRLEHERFKLAKRGNIEADLFQAAEVYGQGDELATVDLYKLMLVYNRLNNRYRLQENAPVHTINQYPYTIEKQKEAIKTLITLNKIVNFSLLKKHSENRVHFVYNFLAMLELLNQQLISIKTGLGYNDFSIENFAATD